MVSERAVRDESRNAAYADTRDGRSATGTPARSLTIGGSEAAACGLDPHKSRVQLWLEKTGKVEKKPAGEAAQWGLLLESVIAGVLDAPPYSLNVGPAVAGLTNESEYPWMHGHPDRFFDTGETVGVLEIKTTGAWRAKEWDDGIPAQPLLQVQHYLALTGLRLGMVACLIGGQKLIVRRCDRDEQVISHMLRLEEEFVGLVESDTPPDPDHRDVEAMGLLYPETRPGFVELTEADYALTLEYRARKAQLKKVGEQADEIKAKLCARLGEYQVGLYDGKPLVKWTEITSERPAKDAETLTYRRFTVAERD